MTASAARRMVFRSMEEDILRGRMWANRIGDEPACARVKAYPDVTCEGDRRPNIVRVTRQGGRKVPQRAHSSRTRADAREIPPRYHCDTHRAIPPPSRGPAH